MNIGQIEAEKILDLAFKSNDLEDFWNSNSSPKFESTRQLSELSSEEMQIISGGTVSIMTTIGYGHVNPVTQSAIPLLSRQPSTI